MSVTKLPPGNNSALKVAEILKRLGKFHCVLALLSVRFWLLSDTGY